VWFIGGILSLLGALTYGELGAMNRAAGGLYVYLRDAFGALPAFLYGWTLFFVISSGSVATLAVAFATYTGQLIDLSPLAGRPVSVAMIVVVAIINVLGTRRSANVQNWTTGVKIAAIIVMSIALIVLGDRLGSVRDQTWPDIGAVADGTRQASFGDTYIVAKAVLLDAQTHRVGIAVSPLLQILGTSSLDYYRYSKSATIGRIQWALPVHVQAPLGSMRVYASAGYFSVGATGHRGLPQTPQQPALSLASCGTGRNRVASSGIVSTSATNVLVVIVKKLKKKTRPENQLFP